MATGRTVSKYFRFIIGDSDNTLRAIPVTSVSGVGVTYDEVDLTALQDAIKGAMPGHPDFKLTISGPFSDKAAASSPTLSGSHTVLQPLNGGFTPRSLDLQFGMQAAWESGDPQFGVTQTTGVGVLVRNYTVDPGTMTYTCDIVMYPGSTAPAWGTAAET